MLKCGSNMGAKSKFLTIIGICVIVSTILIQEAEGVGKPRGKQRPRWRLGLGGKKRSKPGPPIPRDSYNWFRVQQLQKNREIDEAMGLYAYSNQNRNLEENWWRTNPISGGKTNNRNNPQAQRRTQTPDAHVTTRPSWLDTRPKIGAQPYYFDTELRPSPLPEVHSGRLPTSTSAPAVESLPKLKYPTCGADFDHRRFDERCCWEEDHRLRAKIKEAERKGFIVSASSLYWDQSLGQCLLTPTRPILSFVHPKITDGFTCRAQLNCQWFGESGNCHCEPILVSKQLFRNRTYLLYRDGNQTTKMKQY